MWIVTLGVPDSPSQCFLREITKTTAIIMCYHGYDGGQDVIYVVYKAGRFTLIRVTYLNQIYLIN